MQLFATLNPSEAMRLAEYLKELNIPQRANVTTEETGLVVVELFTEDEFYDAACAAAEDWFQKESEEASKNSGWICPSCKFTGYETVDDGSGITLRCPNCGYSIAF
jgi:rubrerythrin